MRDDPFYLTAEQPSARPRLNEDVDSIPVVRLDDLPSLSQSSGASDKWLDYNMCLHVPRTAENSRMPSLRSPSAKPTQTFVIDRAGEMPEGARTPRSLSASKSPSPTPVNGTVPPTVLASFPQYETADEIPRTATPPPIKVTRAKKKTKSVRSGSHKISRTTSENTIS